MKYYNLLNLGTKKLKRKLINNPGLDSEILLSNVLNCDREKILINLDKIATIQQQKKFFLDIKQRENNQPIAQIIGKKEFWKHNFVINKNVLIPRPETEVIVEKILGKINRFSKKKNSRYRNRFRMYININTLGKTKLYWNSIGFIKRSFKNS